MEPLFSPSESMTLSDFGNNSSLVEAQIEQFVVGIMGPNVNKKELEALVVQQQVSDILRANNDLVAIKQFRIANEKMYKDKELAAIRRKEIHEPLTQALTQVEILEERLVRRDVLIEQLRRQIAMLNIEKRDMDVILNHRHHAIMTNEQVEKVKAEQLKDEIVMLERKADADGLLIVKCRRTMKGQQEKIKSLSQLNEKIEFHYKEKVKQLEGEKANLGSLADSKDAKIEQLIEARDFLNQHHMDLQSAMDDVMSQLRECKRSNKEQAETIVSMEGEANILARNWKETLDLYNERNEECVVLHETATDLQSRYNQLVIEMDKMVEYGFNLQPPPATPAAAAGSAMEGEELIYVDDADVNPRSRTSSSAARKKRHSRGKSMRASWNNQNGEGGMAGGGVVGVEKVNFTDEVEPVITTTTTTTTNNAATTTTTTTAPAASTNSSMILQGIKEAQIAVAAAEEKELKEKQLLGLFNVRKDQQDKVARELRMASAAMRVRETLEATISDLTTKLTEEKAARERTTQSMLEASAAVEARRKEEMIQLHNKVHKHERQFHTLTEMLNAETEKVHRLESELESVMRQHESTVEAHMQFVDQVKEEKHLASQRSVPDINLIKSISGQFIDLRTSNTAAVIASNMNENNNSNNNNNNGVQFNDSAGHSRVGSPSSDHPEVDEIEYDDNLLGEDEIAAQEAEYDMFAYMLCWKNVQLNSKGTETMMVEPTMFCEAGVQFDLNVDFSERLTDKQCQTAVIESTVESYLDVLYSDFVMLTRKAVPQVGNLPNESDKFAVHNHGFPRLPVPVPQSTVTKQQALPQTQPQPVQQQSQPLTQAIGDKDNSSPNRKSVIIPSHSGRPISPKTPSCGSTRPTSPHLRPASPKPTVASSTTTSNVGTATTTAAVIGTVAAATTTATATTTSSSPINVPLENGNIVYPNTVAFITEDQGYNTFFGGSESDVLFRLRRAINYLASLNDIRNVAVKDLNRLPLGGTLNSRVLIKTIDMFMQTLHILLSNATNEPPPKTTEVSDYGELLKAVDTENEEYDDEIGDGYRDGVEEAIVDRLLNPHLTADRPLSVHRPRTSSVQDTFKLTQAVLATAETAAGARRGLLSPKTMLKPKVNRTYMNRNHKPRQAVPNVDIVLEKSHQLEVSRSGQNSPEQQQQQQRHHHQQPQRTHYTSDSEGQKDDSDIHNYQSANSESEEVDEEEEVICRKEMIEDSDNNDSSIRERNAAAINKYYNFNREKSFVEKKAMDAINAAPGTQFKIVELDSKRVARMEDDVSVQTPVVVVDLSPRPMAGGGVGVPTSSNNSGTVSGSGGGVGVEEPFNTNSSRPRGPIGPSRYKFKSMMRSTSSNVSEADSDYIDYTRLKFKPFSESNNAYNNERVAAMKPVSRSLKPAVPRARTAGNTLRTNGSNSSTGGSGGLLPTIGSDQYQSSSAVAEIPSASIEREGSHVTPTIGSGIAGSGNGGGSFGGSGSNAMLTERSIALSDTSSFYFNYSEDENDHKYLPLPARFRNNNKSPPRTERRVRTAPSQVPVDQGNFSVSAQPVQLSSPSPRIPSSKKKRNLNSSALPAHTTSTNNNVTAAAAFLAGGTISDENAIVFGGSLGNTNNITSAAAAAGGGALPAVPPTLEESLSLLDISLTQSLAPPLPGTHLMSTTQVKSKLQRLNSNAQTNIHGGIDMLLIGSPANADTVQVMKASPGAPMVVTRPTSGSSTARPSPRVKGITGQVTIAMPTTYFGGPPVNVNVSSNNSNNNTYSNNVGGIAAAVDMQYDARLELLSGNKTTRQ